MSDQPKKRKPSIFSNLWQGTKRRAGGAKSWIAMQPVSVKLALLALAILIPGTGFHWFVQMREQEAMTAKVRAMIEESRSGSVAWSPGENIPVVFGSTPMLAFLESHTIDHVTVIYQPLMWNVTERIILIESLGKHYAYYPSDLETRIFTEKAITASWGNKLVFVPRSDLSDNGRELIEKMDLRFSGARPPVGQENWQGALNSWLSMGLMLGLLIFLYLQTRGQAKSFKFIDPTQIHGSIEDLVGMEDIKSEVAQIKDQYQRQAEYAEYGISKPFNVMFSGPAGTGKTKLAAYLAKELRLPILFHSAANLETGFVSGGSNTLARIVAMAKRRQRCIVFLDEAQDLFMKRGGRRKYDDDTANTFLAVLDGVRSRNDGEIIWIVASNFNSNSMVMDEAMLRRFQMKVDFRLPNPEERLAIINHYLSQRAEKVLPDMDLRHLVAVTEGRSPADLETIVNQAGISAVQTGAMIGSDTLMQAAERVLVGNVNTETTRERDRDRRIIATHEWGHFLVDLAHERQLTQDNWEQILADMKTIKISLKANPRTNALGFVFHKQGPNLLKTKSDIEHEVRVLLGGMANEELFFGEDGTTNGAHNDITHVTRLLHHAVGEMGMYRKTRLNFGALNRESAGGREVDEETRSIMELQSERLFSETKAILTELMPLTRHLVDKLLESQEMGLDEALTAIREFEAGATLLE